MQRYYFHFFNGDQWLEDKSGQAFDNYQAVFQEAKFALINLSKEHLELNGDLQLSYKVTDKNSKVIYRVTISFTEEFEVVPPCI